MLIVGAFKECVLALPASGRECERFTSSMVSIFRSFATEVTMR